ncbi:MAG TPA: FAD:protein FMN transferase [Candidatus Avalokitesvara rifleensis]|uniref:FAD:protein FMN transferase n=1 Tax=Candidatus Avalokitesvara rifleensis TaxID=3367620 RepID=UPI004027827E
MSLRHVSLIIFMAFLSAADVLAQVSQELEPPDNFQPQVFLTQEQALSEMFPDCDEILRDVIILTDEEKNALEDRLKRKIYEQGFEVFIGKEEGEIQGYAIITEEIGKFHPFTFIVAVEPNGKIEDLAVLVYRESRGGDVARRRFLHQFIGKSVRSPVKINRDIINITGATMSVVTMCSGVKKVLGVVDEFYLSGKRGLENASPLVSKMSSQGPQELLKETRLIMGTYADISVYGSDKENAAQAIKEAFEEMERLDGLMSNYKSSSELSRINREASRAPTKCAPELLGVIEDSLDYSTLTEGAFDITVEPLVNKWGFYTGKVGVPNMDEIKSILPAVSYKNIDIQGQGDSKLIAFKHPGTKIDLGGIGKGYAADKAVEVLKRRGITSAMVNLGGNIYALGRPPGASAWKIGVQHPRQRDFLLGYLELENKGVATSGDYERFFMIDGKRYSHIIDPRTGMPAHGLISVTVTADSAMEADALSTGAFILGPKRGAELLDGREGVGGIFACEGDGGEIGFTLTKSMNKLFKKELAVAEDNAETPELSFLK